MKDSHINYVIVGVFVLAMGAALIGALAVLMGRTGPTETYFTVYDNVGGLKPGTQVTFEGYPIGQVARIEPMQQDGRLRFRLHLDVQRNWPVPEQSETRVAASGLLSAVTVDIQAGAGPGLLPPGAEIRGRASGSLFSVMDDVAADVREMTRDIIRPLLHQVTGYLTALGSALEDDGTRMLAGARVAAEAIAQESPRIAQGLAVFTDRLALELMSEKNLENLSATLDNAQAASGSIRALSRDLETASRQIDTLLQTLNSLASESQDELRGAASELRYSLEVVARHIDSIAHSLDGTGRNMLEFSRSLRQNPGLLLRGSAIQDEAYRR